ncbi:hypothetical protein N7456_010661 [Penicillium angulare]|uniref:F-box domain-containing protein n=1 Tax=Penicillium angulare TaxID=116970 RepID=A0A9W9K6Q5_9EURO|nr:hypothetical protein N7456_010661 [Penicillium angulare]
MESINLSPQLKAILTPEILENILLYLDQKSLLISAQRVCRFWHDLISQAPPLQRLLFFQPHWDLEDTYTSDLLAEKFPLFFKYSPGQPDQSKETMQVNTLDLWKDRSLFETLPLASPHRNEAFMYEGSSWRHMLVQQPPIPKFAVFSAFNARRGDFFSVPYMVEQLLKTAPDDGADSKPPDISTPLRMGQFYDQFTILEGQSPWAFMIMWNSGEIMFPPKIDKWTFQDEDKRVMKQALEAYGMIVVARKVLHSCEYVLWAPGKQFVFDKWWRGEVEKEEKREAERQIRRDKIWSPEKQRREEKTFKYKVKRWTSNFIDLVKM